MPNYPMQLSDMQNYVLTLINEDANSPAGALLTGSGGSPTITTVTQITQFLNEAAADFARYAYTLQDTASYTTFPANTIYVQFKNALLVSATYYQIWAAETVSYNGVKLTHCAKSALETTGINFTANFPNDTAGIPVYWFEEGTDGIGIYPASSSSSYTLKVTGRALPVQLVGSTDVTPYQADQNKILCYYAAARIALKNMEDASLSARAQPWMAEWERYTGLNLARLWGIDNMDTMPNYPRPAPGAAPADATPSDSSEPGV